MEGKDILDKVAGLFDEYKKTNDAALEAKAKGHEARYNELEAQLKKMDADMTALKDSADAELKAARIQAAANVDAEVQEKNRARMAQKSFFSVLHRANDGHLSDTERDCLVKAEIEASKAFGLPRNEAQVKGLLSGIDQAAGLFIPVQTERNVLRLVQDEVALYRLAEKATTGTSSYERPVQLTDAAAQWVGEVETRNETAAQTYGSVRIDIHTCMAQPKVSSELLEDAYVDMEAEMMNSLRTAFTNAFGKAFIEGSGVKAPRGILSYGMTEENESTKAAYGNVGFVKSGQATALSADGLIDVITMLKAPYRTGANFLMNAFTEAAVRKLKNSEGGYLWQPSLIQGKPNTLLGYPVEIDENMPNVAAGKFPIAFGNFRRAYLVVERRGMRVIRDTTSATPWIIFKTDARIGGGLQNTEALKFLKVSA